MNYSKSTVRNIRFFLESFNELHRKLFRLQVVILYFTRRNTLQFYYIRIYICVLTFVF